MRAHAQAAAGPGDDRYLSNKPIHRGVPLLTSNTTAYHVTGAAKGQGVLQAHFALTLAAWCDIP
ncbi:hypothetical protein SHIRM173S_02649 [Streptomyces hirsutus]